MSACRGVKYVVGGVELVCLHLDVHWTAAAPATSLERKVVNARKGSGKMAPFDLRARAPILPEDVHDRDKPDVDL